MGAALHLRFLQSIVGAVSCTSILFYITAKKQRHFDIIIITLYTLYLHNIGIAIMNCDFSQNH